VTESWRARNDDPVRCVVEELQDQNFEIHEQVNVDVGANRHYDFNKCPS